MHIHTKSESIVTQSPPDDDCFAIRQAARYVSQLYDRHLGKAGLKISQYSILHRVQRKPGITMKELAEAMVMERTTLVRAIQPLQRDGLVQSDVSEVDRRALKMSLTPAGRARLEAASTHWYAAQDEFEKHFGAQRAALLRQELFELTKKPV
ncbi:MarR family winged helix-turn-helix transcriptional regulator [Paraburkholderia rhizosphaerae]|uniref:MarR family transcriptional regulator n=1 Tax=Paraburkholderia rhizosphaerae TaxID=480658 RepID=A0A4R8M017_9BURK|nr:MarR family winged helix-turn-helix transcriptional regulator [Paraburkholderia rhizosphaerae]TDY52360.1 MarR family transcriptional regulator [Paraburkholderia rhizosphaerae]